MDGSAKIEIGLTKLKGLGLNLAKVIVEKAKLSGELRIGNLTDLDVQRVEDVFKNPKKYDIPDWLLNRRKDSETGQDVHLMGPDLSLGVKSDIDNMKQMRSLKGIRHSLGLKVRGQRTKTSGRTGRAVGVRRRQVRMK